LTFSVAWNVTPVGSGAVNRTLIVQVLGMNPTMTAGPRLALQVPGDVVERMKFPGFAPVKVTGFNVIVAVPQFCTVTVFVRFAVVV